MFCCCNCFSNSELKAIIDAKKVKGDCDFCGSHDVHVYEIGTDDTLAQTLDGLLDVYTPVSDLPADYPREHTGMLKDVFYNNWNLFSVKPELIYRLLISICSERYSIQPSLFDGPVGIKQIQDHSYLEENTILMQYCWKDFVEGIKHKNRFHSDYINKERLLQFLRCVKKVHHRGETFFRARICPDSRGYKRNEMGPPPENIAKAGRVNPSGISVLYLSDSLETTLYEIRAGVYDYVTVGRFKLQKDIDVINLTSIDQISPFIGDLAGFDYTQYALNIEHLKMIAQEIAKPLRNDNTLDYLPTQYISDFIRSKQFHGIEYISTMKKNGANLAVFDPEMFKCTGTSVYDITSIKYDYNRI